MMMILKISKYFQISSKTWIHFKVFITIENNYRHSTIELPIQHYITTLLSKLATTSTIS
jgi:hypothetical protein